MVKWFKVGPMGSNGVGLGFKKKTRLLNGPGSGNRPAG